MIAVLLAAGSGRRLGSNHPKALLRFGGRTLLDRHLENLAGVETLVVTGFRAGLLTALPQLRWTVHNPRFERGSVVSLALALDAVADRGEDVVVMDADVLYEPSILRDVIALRRGFALDASVTPGDEEMMLGVRAGRVRALRRGRMRGFDLTGESVGFTALDAASLPRLRDAAAAADPGGDYEATLDAFVAEHGAGYVRVDGRAWIEIDFPQDVERARREVLPRLEGSRRRGSRAEPPSTPRSTG